MRIKTEQVYIVNGQPVLEQDQLIEVVPLLESLYENLDYKYAEILFSYETFVDYLRSVHSHHNMEMSNVVERMLVNACDNTDGRLFNDVNLGIYTKYVINVISVVTNKKEKKS